MSFNETSTIAHLAGTRRMKERALWPLKKMCCLYSATSSPPGSGASQNVPHLFFVVSEAMTPIIDSARAENVDMLSGVGGGQRPHLLLSPSQFWNDEPSPSFLPHIYCREKGEGGGVAGKALVHYCLPQFSYSPLPRRRVVFLVLIHWMSSIIEGLRPYDAAQTELRD